MTQRIATTASNLRIAAGAACAVLAAPAVAFAYIGPGAGFAFLGSGMVLILALGFALLTVLALPFRWILKAIKRSRRGSKAEFRRVVIVGLDGMDPKLVERMMADGDLPNFSELAKTGGYSRLGTTTPALSPVAWSSFQTGTNPGAHNIFDFLTRDKRFCLPELSSSKVMEKKRAFTLGPIRIPLGKRATVKLFRRSKPFWHHLAKHGVPSNVLRVPVSYPPEKFSGNILSAMCTPDLRGSQGTFSLYSTAPAEEGTRSGELTSGRVLRLDREVDTVRGVIEGPPHPKKKNEFLRVPFTAKVLDDGAVSLDVCGASYMLTVGKYSEWVRLKFKVTGTKAVHGIVRLCVRSTSPEFVLYSTPVNIDPEKPALPISAPVFFSMWLSKLQGAFGTLGLLEDTWGRNEGAIDDQLFLDQAYLAHEERERMFFETLERTREGLCVCVFDATDRIQHMFWRYLDPAHKAPREDAQFTAVIPDLYHRMDALLGRIRAKLKPDDLFIVLSDHGFASFRRCVGLNRWLYDNGYLAVKGTAPTGRDFFADVDWEKTRAFAVGLTGIYINRIGRERFGIVDEQEAQRLSRELQEKLQALRDPRDDSVPIQRVYAATDVYSGLYTAEAPDLIVGYAPGYRVSWDSITGTIEPEVFSDNTKAWSGDHHVDPKDVPGILFANRKLTAESPHIMDIAPTALKAFGLSKLPYMEGKALI